MTGLRVLIVDDHEGFRRAAAALLTASGYEVVGSAVDGESTVAMTKGTTPDVVLLDVSLPGIDGVEVAQRLARLDSPPRVILVSSRDDAGDQPHVRAAPALGFIAKRDLSPGSLAAMLA